VAVGGDQNDGSSLVVVYLERRIDAVHVRHLDVGENEVGTGLATLLDQLPTVLGDSHNLVAESRQDPSKIIAHVRLVIGDGNARARIHGGSRRRGMRIPALRGGEPPAIRPPCASTMPSAIAMPKRVPFVLIVKNGSKTRFFCSADRPRPLSRTAMC